MSCGSTGWIPTEPVGPSSVKHSISTTTCCTRINDKLIWGNRLEWYHIDNGVYGVTDGSSDIYVFTTGLNYRATGNLLFRPEVRWDWDKDGVAGLELGQSQTTFGMDAILTF